MHFSTRKRFEGPGGLTIFPALNGALLLIPHHAPDDSGFTLMIKSPSAPFVTFDDTNDGPTADFFFTGFDIDTEEGSFTGERGMLAWTKATASTGTFNISGETPRNLSCSDGIFQFTNNNVPDKESYGLHPSDGVIVRVDKKEGESDAEFGVHVALETWPQE